MSYLMLRVWRVMMLVFEFSLWLLEQIGIYIWVSYLNLKIEFGLGLEIF